MKMVQMQKITKEKQIQHLYNERDVLCYLQQMNRPSKYFPKLYATFKSEVNINFVMEQVDGMTLYEFQKEQLCIKLDHAKYFAAVILQMLETLHKKKIIFRDLKPENIMVKSSTAELVLVDFGFAKFMKSGQSSKVRDQQPIDRTFTKCGTPGYSAPEILTQADVDNCFDILTTRKTFLQPELTQSKFKRGEAGAGYSYPCDIWSWGVLLCELIGGYNPFHGESIGDTFDNILAGNVQYPRNLNPQCMNLLQTIFNRDPNLRPSIQNIKQSYFFQDVNWSHLESSFNDEIADIRTILSTISNKKSLKLNQLASVSSNDMEQPEFNDFQLDDEEEPNKGSPKKGYTLFNKNVSKMTMTQVQSRKIHDALADF